MDLSTFGGDWLNAQQGLSKDLFSGMDGFSNDWFDSVDTNQTGEGGPMFRPMFNQTGMAGLSSLFGEDAQFNLDNKLGQFNISNPQGQSLFSKQFTPDGDDFFDQLMSTAIPAFAAGGMTGGLGFGNGFLGSLAKGATSGGLQSAMQGDNIGEGMFKGAASQGIGSFNPAATMGVSNPIMAGGINKGFGGAATAAMSGGDVGKGALGGFASGAAVPAVQSGLSGLSSMFQPESGQPQMSMAPYQPSLARASIDEMLGQSRPQNMLPQFDMNAGTFGQTSERDEPQSFSSLGGFHTPAMPSDSSGGFNNINSGVATWLESDIGKKFGELLGTVSKKAGTPAGQSLIKGALGAYGYHRNNKAHKQQINNLQSMFGPNSPYSQQLNQALSRKDAAAGRRSQYGPRNVELQARLAEMNSRNAPMLAQLNTAKNQNRDRLINTGYQLFKGAGGMKGIGDLFGIDSSPYKGGMFDGDGFTTDPYAGV